MNLLKRLLRKIEKPKRMYVIDGIKIDLGKDHKLSLLQKYNPMYDRFVKFLGGGVENDGIFLDIGANVGDTLAAIIKYVDGICLCVEPSNDYYQLLKRNVSSFPNEYRSKVITDNSIISSEKGNFTIDNHGHGTGYVVESFGVGMDILTIPELFEKHKLEINKLDVLKTDTDGFDASCIMSIGETFKNIHPIIYFENLVHNADECQNFYKLYDYLEEYGYDFFYFFDNYGNYVCSGDNITAKELLDYHYSTRIGKSHRTIMYFDIMACKNIDRNRCERILSDYLKEYR